MRFRTDRTKGGHRIISFHGPDKYSCYSGVLDQDGEYAGVNWSTAGVEFEDNPDYDLIPLAEEPRNASEPQLQEFFEQVLDKRMAKLEAQYAKTEDWVEGYQEAFDELERRIEQSHNDCIARINGLRNDERIAVLKERVEKLEAYNSRLDLWREDQEEFTEATWLRVLQIAKKLEADRNLPQTPSLGQDSIAHNVRAAVEKLFTASGLDLERNWRDCNVNLSVPGYLVEELKRAIKRY